MEDDHFDQTVTEAAGFVVGIVCLSMACAAIRLNRGWKSQGGLSWIGTSKRPDMTLFGLWQTPTLFGQQSSQSAEDELRMLCSTFELTMLSCDIIRNSCRSTILWKLSQGTDWLKRCLHRPVAALAKGSPTPDIRTDYQTFLFPPMPYALVLAEALQDLP